MTLHNLHLSSELAAAFPARVTSIDGRLMQSLLRQIADAEAETRMAFERGRAGGDVDQCAADADRHDDIADRGREQVKRMILAAFPGVDLAAVGRVIS